ncbi:MAG: hypothetical protein ABIG37_02480 [Nanoarchaeota archaeon]
MKTSIKSSLLAIVLSGIVSGYVAFSKPVYYDSKNQFIQISPRSFETSVMRFEDDKGIKVDLYNMSHYSDRKSGFFKKIEKEFDKHDYNIYEGPKKGKRKISRRIFVDGFRLLRGFESFIPEAVEKNLASIYHQNDIIKPGKELVIADVTVEEFEKQFTIDSTYKMFLKNIKAFPFERIKSVLRLVLCPFNYVDKGITSLRYSKEEYESRVRNNIIGSLVDYELEEGLGPCYDSMIEYRNNICLEEVDRITQEIKSNSEKKIGIYWGASHGKGIRRGLIKRGFREINERKRWLKVMDF